MDEYIWKSIKNKLDVVGEALDGELNAKWEMTNEKFSNQKSLDFYFKTKEKTIEKEPSVETKSKNTLDISLVDLTEDDDISTTKEISNEIDQFIEESNEISDKIDEPIEIQKHQENKNKQIIPKKPTSTKRKLDLKPSKPKESKKKKLDLTPSSSVPINTKGTLFSYFKKK